MTKTANPQKPPTQRFSVVLEQSIFYAITIEAKDAAEAESLAHAKYDATAFVCPDIDGFNVEQQDYHTHICEPSETDDAEDAS